MAPSRFSDASVVAYPRGVQRETISTQDAPAAIGPYSQGVMVTGGCTLYVSGQVALDPATGGLVGEGEGEASVRAQAEQVMKNVGAVLEAGGMSFANVVRATIFLTDLGNFGVVNEIYGRHFPGEPPARACVEVSRLPKDVAVEIDCIAVGPERAG